MRNVAAGKAHIVKGLAPVVRRCPIASIHRIAESSDSRNLSGYGMRRGPMLLETPALSLACTLNLRAPKKNRLLLVRRPAIVVPARPIIWWCRTKPVPTGPVYVPGILQ